jgi:hypothetical protein
MGSINKFDIIKIASEYDLTVFVETGTFMGDAIESLRHLNKFNKLISIEIKKEFADNAKKRFESFDFVEIIEGDSAQKLIEIIEKIKDERVLWWLDAHLPDHYDSSANNLEPFPLHKELDNIFCNRNVENDFFIIDDLRIYEKADFKSGNWDKCSYSKWESCNENSKFIDKMFEETHIIEKSYEDEGYIIIKPKIYNNINYK